MTSRLEALLLWGGGAAFVASLVWSGYVYLVRWAVGGELSQAWPRAAAANTALFVLFALHHSLFAREAVKRWMGGLVAPRLNRSTYVWVASALLVALMELWQPVRGTLYRSTLPVAVVHLTVQLAGVVLIGRAVRAIDGLELAGIRPFGGGGSLTASGPYRLVRHPLYLGWFLLVLGPAHMTGDRLLFAVLTCAYLIVAVPWEERSLERTFGEAYARYRGLVRWRIIPFVY
jgi:protein-S-isoprenylcysteine O-methyltransferase Ste14